jgi:hypothetical protein
MAQAPCRSLSRFLMLALPRTLLASASAQNPPDPAVEAAIQGFRTAPAADSGTLTRSAEALQRLVGQHPVDPRLLAYTGAATARLSRTTLLPWKKMRHAEDGLAQLDKALALIRPEHEQAPAGGVPPALETRLVAANTFLAMPGMFNRGARGEKLLAELLNLPTLATAPAAFRSAVFFLAGEHARQTDRPAEARRHYERVIGLKELEADAARAALAGLPS